MGKNSYEVVSNFDTWPYEGKRVVVLSSTLISVCDKAELFKGDIARLIEELYADGIKHIHVDGGDTISRFLNMELIDHMIISIVPVVLGAGIPLFSKINSDKRCRLISSQAYSNGLVQLRYDPVR